ncbi:hypothetical protein IG631_17217 [Alternaria alternata]|nr:hypothetical protein IG631_17217 [Alternaria alternata]
MVWDGSRSLDTSGGPTKFSISVYLNKPTHSYLRPSRTSSMLPRAAHRSEFRIGFRALRKMHNTERQCLITATEVAADIL